MTSVSIGIPTWNRKELVERAVASVLTQDYRGPLEVVVADDGSTDGTVDWLRSRFLSERRLKVFAGAHGGIARAKNRALLGGSGELRGILDSDDYYEPSFVRRCVEELEARPEVGLVYTDNYVQRRGSPERRVERSLDWSVNDWLRTRNLRGDCWLARWSLLERTRLHDERMELEVDYDLFYQMAALAPFRRIAEPLQTVTIHAGRTTLDRGKAAYWHAAGLAKYGHDVRWAVVRAHDSGRSAEWARQIKEGYEWGKSLRDSTS